ncbi:branched-chain amino acid ABC transporter permease [Pusillimonas sp. MFBS29]|uniref:branched-chain amino acid ABC transporter permease n=1 Tax=Pusillimonas sp. MFBS29 TaxID=2886690 RepID=UPI001D100BB3|nr:branched-chain amino acid ABC transporter permease [Pusillimonas sp. MFBS29]MCC2595851.1 branched-chain amino acid ABC transporter permease [Pusillimonas sp. MFBS29]
MITKHNISQSGNPGSQGSPALKGLALLVGAVIAIGWPFVLNNPFLTHIGVLFWMFTLLALSMNLMLRMGQLSLAHGALMGLGAYGSALLMMRLNVPFVLAFPASGLIGALFALITGPIMLKIKGVYFVLLTFAFGEIVILTFIEWVDLFGGNNGLFGVPRASFFGIALKERWAYYLFALVLAALAYLGVRALYKSEVGAVIDALDTDEDLARSLGVNALRYRLVVFTISGFLAGIAGGFYASYYTFVTPDGFTFWTAVNAIIMNVLGGIALPIGSVLGALLIVPLPEILRDAKEYQNLAYGVVLIIFLLFLPNGFIGAYRQYRERRQRT